MSPISLYELNNKIKSVLKAGLSAGIWIHAEISSINVQRVGHCYIELIEKDENTGLTIGDLFVDKTRHEVSAKGEKVTLTLKEFELLCLLVENKGKVLTRDQLLNSIWGYEFDGENRTVDVHIRTLRQKLGVCGEYIETVRGVGYKVGGKV